MSRTKMMAGASALAAMLALASCATGAADNQAAAPPQAAGGAVADTLAATARDPVAQRIASLDYDIPYTKYVLKNGLTLLVHEDTKTPTVTFHLWYHVGSKNEPKGRSGFAHLFEHLMFNGSEHFNDDFFKATQKIGATNQNGSTSYDRTNYYQTVPKAALDTILWLESDRMGHLLGAVDQSKLDEQRGVVQNEKRQGENQPYGQVNNHTIAATYPENHPYGHSVIGSMDDLDAASLEDVRDWFRTWYGPSNAVLVLAGDIKPDEAKAKVEKFFGEIPSGPPVSHPKSWVPELAQDQREVMYDRVAQPRIYRVWNVPELGNPDGELLDHAASALGGDKNARLTKRLVHDEQVATSVIVGNGQSEIAGQFRVIVTAKPDADLAHIEAVIDEEIGKLLQTGPTQAEIDKNIVQVVSGEIRGLQSAASKAATLATWETYTGNGAAWKESIKRLEAATPATVRTAAQKWLTRGSYTLTVMPFGDPEASGQTVDRSKVPEPGSIADVSFPKYETATLSNGVKVMLAERHDAPLVSVRMMLDTGYPADLSTVKDGLGGLTANLLDEGTTTRSGLQIADELDRLGAAVLVGGGGETTTIEMSSLTVTLDQVMAIWADVIRNPAFTDTDFKRLQAQQVQALQQAMREPNAIGSRVMSKILWGDSHPYGRLVTPAEVQALTPADTKAFHKRWFGPNNATLYVVGDTTMAQIKPKLEAALAGWANAPGKRQQVANGTRPAKPSVYLVDRPGSVQSVILVGSPQAPRNPAEDTKVSAFNALFGGNFDSRVNMNLREDKGWSYGARSSMGGGRGPRTFLISAPVQTDQTKGALVELRKELTDIVGRRPPSAAELNTVRTNTLLGMASRWETSGAVMDTLSDISMFNLPADYWDKYAATYRAVTPSDVEAMAKQVIPNQNHVWVVVGDRAKIEKGIRELNIGELHIVDANGDPID
ncbi:MAG TPA: pitrilysin family protein [Hyphomonadaceae bacterium]|nr:pitrilysin family protein [Hyphomonadaceae bacterium]